MTVIARMPQSRMRTIRLCIPLLCAVALCGCGPDPGPEAGVGEQSPPPATLRVATFNVSLYEREAGGLIARLEAGDEDASRVAAILQHLRPDVVLLNEFDYDSSQRALALFRSKYLDVAQSGQAPIAYPHAYSAPVNTGVPSGLDLDGDGRVGGTGDAWGFGHHPGQYGMLVLSRFPIDSDAVRSFRLLPWSQLPQADRPLREDGTPHHTDAIWSQLRLSSKSHWDVPIDTPLGRVHLLASHPTPPVFDGPEDLNGRRNADELRLWAEYLSIDENAWLCDDAGRCGGLAADAQFVIAGDLNSDPVDGDSRPGSIARLLEHPRIDARFVPRSDGAAVRAAQHGLARKGDIATHTGDFGPRAGTMRLDYLLPSRGLRVRDGGVFWPLSPPAHVEWAGASDHHLVWLDLESAATSTASETRP